MILAALVKRFGPLAAKLAAIACVLLAIAASWFYVKSILAERDDAQDKARTAQETVGRRNATITDLQKKEREHANALAQLEAKRQDIAAQLEQSARDFESLKDEKPDVRAWADTPLPADIVRLYNRPAITGAGDESGAAMRARDPLHAASDGAAH